MKLKISLPKTPSHTAPVTCVGWSSTEEVYSASDDNQILSWLVSNHQSTKVAQIKDFYPTDLHFLPRSVGSLGKHGDLILITTADGKFHIMNRAGRIERSVEAHKGAILAGQWGNDGTGLLTAGEDGSIKIWSRSGMLRSTVVSSDSSVYGACWSPDSSSIAHTQGKYIVIKHLAPNTKPLRWKAHDGLVLCLAWSVAADLIVSGGEDCKYRVWDNQSRLVFSSGSHDNHITSLSWAPTGNLFAVASYNTIRLCDYSGWSRSLEKPNSGCIYKLAWSGDGTQLAGACANGNVLFASIVQRQVDYLNFIAIVTEKKIVTIRDVLNDTSEQLELPERVIQIAMRYSHLVLTTPGQCYIYGTNNWNTPAIFDLKDGSVIFLQLCEKYLLLVERSNVGIYNYQGRLVASPRWPNMRLDSIRSQQISISSDTLAIRDYGDPKIVHIIDLGSSSRNQSNESSMSIHHCMGILEISLDQWGSSSTRRLAVLDKAHDLHLVQVRSGSGSHIFLKLGRKVESFQWNSEENILAALQDTQLVVWYCPNAAFSPGLLKICSMQYDSPELGRSPRINDFVGSSVSIRRADGSLINVPISTYPLLLHKYVRDNKWNDALNLCRSSNDKTLWACLAVLATRSSEDVIDIAEEAYACINHYDKVFYIQNVKSFPNKCQQKASMALLGGDAQEAESILLHNGMVFHAIYNHAQLHNWSRALDLAIKHKTHIDTILYLRQQYLDALGKPENNNKFSSLKEAVQIDEEKVQQKIEMELKRNKN